MNDIPASLKEIEKIKQIIPDADTLLNSSVTEEKIKQMSVQGILKNYKILHFSTHGIAIPQIPQLSALILSLKNSESNEDGFLNMNEVAGLQINADFVNLSACETGGGKVYSGEGITGLSQAFLIAGANGLLASQWEIDDDATSVFMEEFYKIIKDEKVSFAKAINDVKRKFIKGETNIFWKLPFFWAPFLYYGNI
jgi:CHAT domain-containing protein